MALTNIEYGSVASSEIMNKNFLYLDERITELSDSINTTLSSVLSNIATLNTRLGDISEDIQDDAQLFSSRLDEYKNKSRLCFNKLSMLPNWGRCFALTAMERRNYTAIKNGYLLLKIPFESTVTLTINETQLELSNSQSDLDGLSQMSVIPLRAGDNISCDSELSSAYFLPTVEISTDEL